MRRVPRLPVQLPVTLESAGTVRQGNISDLGLLGAFLSIKPPVALNSLATLRFNPPKTRQSLEVLAKVVRTTDEGAGLEFLDLDPEDQEMLWAALAHLWPRDLKDCPYCGSPLNSKLKSCPLCHLPLDFQEAGYLEKLLEGFPAPREMIGTCPGIHHVFQLIRKLATTDVPILIAGESGTGKEMVAQAIHQRSRRAEGPFIPVNCGAIPRELLESELFGHEKGSFTGAYRTVAGKVEMAHGGTLFLDEVGELPLELQVKLLRFLQEYSFERVGGRETKQVDLRIISATNKDLRELVVQGKFRDDLYYRLKVVNIELPPLRERGDDALIIAHVLLRRYATKTGKTISGFSEEALKAIKSYPWQGNVRELINHIRRAVVMADGPWVTPENLGLELDTSQDQINGLGLKEAMDQFEKTLVKQALENYRWNVESTAKALGASRGVIYYLIRKHGLNGPKAKALSPALLAVFPFFGDAFSFFQDAFVFFQDVLQMILA